MAKKKELDVPVKFEAEAVVLWEGISKRQPHVTIDKIEWNEQPLKKSLELKGGPQKGEEVKKLHKRSLMLLLTPPAGLKAKFSAPYVKEIQSKFEDDKKKEGKVAFMSVTKEFVEGSDQKLVGKDVLITYRVVPSDYKGKKGVFLNVTDLEVLEKEEDNDE